MMFQTDFPYSPPKELQHKSSLKMVQVYAPWVNSSWSKQPLDCALPCTVIIKIFVKNTKLRCDAKKNDYKKQFWCFSWGEKRSVEWKTSYDQWQNIYETERKCLKMIVPQCQPAKHIKKEKFHNGVWCLHWVSLHVTQFLKYTWMKQRRVLEVNETFVIGEQAQCQHYYYNNDNNNNIKISSYYYYINNNKKK